MMNKKRKLETQFSDLIIHDFLTQVEFCQTPESLIYQIVISDREMFTKTELLETIKRLHQLFSKKSETFEGDCNYIV